MREMRFFVVNGQKHLTTKMSLAEDVPAEDLDEIWDSLATEDEVEAAIKGLKSSTEIVQMIEMVIHRRKEICLSAEDMLAKAQPGTRFSVGFQSMVEVTGNDGESITYIDEDGRTITSSRADMQKAFEEQYNKDMCRYMPILVE